LVIKKYYYRGIYRRNEADKFIFLLPTDLPTDKKLPTKDLPTEHFHLPMDKKLPTKDSPTEHFRR
jgi:hypothetical protein